MSSPPWNPTEVDGRHSVPAPRPAPDDSRMNDAASWNAAAARLCAAQGYKDAVPLFERALAACRVALGAADAATLTVAGNLGVAYVGAGQRRKGIKLITDNVDERARLWGEEDPGTLTARDALAAAHRAAGNVDDAVSLSGQVAVQRTKALGRSHPDTLTSRMGLALAQAAAGDMASARRLLAGAIDDAEQALGKRHDHTLALRRCGEANGLLNPGVQLT